MAQPRWPAAPKFPSRQGPLLLDNQLKNITHHVVLSSPTDTGIPLKNPIRRNMPYQRSNDQNMKRYLKESGSGPQADAPCKIAGGGTESLEAHEKDSKKRVHLGEAKSAAPTKRFIIKIPSEPKIERSSSLESAPFVSSEAVDGLESSARKGLQFYGGDSTGHSDSALSVQDFVASEVDQPSKIEVLDPAYLQSHPGFPETEVIQDILPSTAPTQPPSENLSTDPAEDSAELSPTPSITVPHAPPTTPITIPKREIKLVTASSSAAEWFTRGFVVSASKTSQILAKGIDTPPKDAFPPADVGKPEAHVEVPSEESMDPEGSGVPWEQDEPKRVDVDSPSSSVPERDEETVKLDPVPDVIETSVDQIPPNKHVGSLSSLEPPAKSTVETVEVISEQKISFSINHIVRPYYLCSAAGHCNVNNPSTTDTPIASPINPQSLVSCEVPEYTALETCPVEMKLDPQTDCPIHIPGREDDGAKMKWFREEMRQSPERDGSWTVMGSERRTPPVAAVSDDAESSTSSVAMEFVMIESTNISSSMTALDELPVVIPLDLNKDEIIAESVQTPASAPANIDISTAVQASKEVTHRYIIRGGQVRRSETGNERRPSVPEPTSSGDALSEVGSLSAKNEMNELRHQEPSAIPESLPQRKANKFTISTRPTSGDSDGWSTDTETEPKVTSSVKQTEASVGEELGISTTAAKEGDISGMIDDGVQNGKAMEKTHMPESMPLEQVMQSASDVFDQVRGALEISVPQEASADTGYSSNTLADESLEHSQLGVEKDVPKYQIIAGQVRKVSSHRSRPGTPSPIASVPPTPSDSSTPQTTFTRPTIEKVYTPQCIKKFVYCGDTADHEMVESLGRGGSHPLHGQSQMLCGPQVRKCQLEDSCGGSSQFHNSKTNPINKPSVREEKFDPFSRESEANLKRLKDEFAPMLEFHPSVAIASLLSKAPQCFCLKQCARFDGIVPVYVCGAFKSLPPNSGVAKGCTFHMHVSFWGHLHNTFEWYGRDKDKAFADESLIPHLLACPYLNFTFCVKFSKQNTFPMYLPAELRATNLCACDLNMRLDFSELLQHWVFSCPHFHQPGAPKKCVTRLLVMLAKYRLIDTSPNLHGGGTLPANAQTVILDDKFPAGRVAEIPHVHLPSVDGICEPRPRRDDAGEVVTQLFRSFTINAAGSKEWLGENPSDEALAEYDNNKKEIVEMTMKLLTQYLESYLSLEKLYDIALCQKIRDDEQRKREEMRMRLKSNNIPCMGCTEQNPMAIFVPCYHMVMCEKCSGKVKVCPTCRRDIKESHRVYIA